MLCFSASWVAFIPFYKDVGQETLIITIGLIINIDREICLCSGGKRFRISVFETSFPHMAECGIARLQSRSVPGVYI